jgi:molybdopterin synthase sulfur carrier subunit
MKIQVKGYLTYRELIGTRNVKISAPQATLWDCLQVLAIEIGEEFYNQVLDMASGGVQPHIALLLNGQHYRHLQAGLDTQLQNGDQLAIFPPIAGG